MVVVDGLEPLLVLADEAKESRPERLQGLEHRQGHRALLHGDPKVPEGWQLVSLIVVGLKDKIEF